MKSSDWRKERGLRGYGCYFACGTRRVEDKPYLPMLPVGRQQQADRLRLSVRPAAELRSGACVPLFS